MIKSFIRLFLYRIGFSFADGFFVWTVNSDRNLHDPPLRMALRIEPLAPSVARAVLQTACSVSALFLGIVKTPSIPNRERKGAHFTCHISCAIFLCFFSCRAIWWRALINKATPSSFKLQNKLIKTNCKH